MENKFKEKIQVLESHLEQIKQLPHKLKPKAEKILMIGGVPYKVTLTEGAWVIVQFKTLEQAEQFYNSL